MLSGIGIRVITVRKQDHLHVHALFENQIYSSERRMYPCRIPVINDGHVLRIFTDQADLLHCQRRTAGSHNVMDTQLIHRDDIQIALHQDALVLTDDFIPGKPYPVQGTALDIDFRLRGIHVFRDGLVRPQRAASECQNPAGGRMYREHGPVVKPVSHLPVITSVAQTCVYEEFFLVSCLPRRIEERRPG